MIPCYVSGKGMYATDMTLSFKVRVMTTLESTGLGYDTQFRYYRQRLPELDDPALARLICDPVENYDPDWPEFLKANRRGRPTAEVVTEFMLSLDNRFREEARCAVYCYDEAGFGSGVNTMRFLLSGKPVLGFYDTGRVRSPSNLSNVLQLRLIYPDLVTLMEYSTVDEIPGPLSDWLEAHFASPD